MEELKPDQPLFTTIKLRKASVIPKPEKLKTEEPKRFLLKSRITRIQYPPEIKYIDVKELHKVEVDCGILSRNYKEAEKIPKKKAKKIKLPEKEETQLEEYEPYQEEPESPKEEKAEKVIKPRDRPGKKLSKEEEPEKMVLGKGTVPKEEEKPEEIKLRKVKPKEETEEIPEEKPKKKPEEETVSKKKPKEEKSLDKLEPLEDLPIEGGGIELEKPEKLPDIEKPVVPKEEEPVKRKSLKKKKPEPEEPSGFPLGKGKPRPEEEPADITLRKPTPKDEETPSEEMKLKPFKKEKPEAEEEASPEVKLTIGKPTEKPEEEDLETVSIKKKKPKKKETKPDDEEVSVVIKPKKIEEAPAEAEVVRLRKPSKPEDQEVEEQIVLMRKKPEKKVIEEVESDFTIKKIEQTYTEEEAFDDVTIKKKAPKKPYVMEEEAAEITIQKEEPVKKTEPEDTMMLKVTFKEKPQEEEEVTTTILKPRKPKISEEVSEEVTIKKEKRKSVTEETVSAEAMTLKKITKAKKKYSISEEAEELTIQQTEEVEEVPAVSFRKPSRPKISEEELPAQAITLKKPKKPQPEEPEMVESVTFAPKVVKHKEDIEQEFSIKMGSYEEEEVEMSGKVKLPRKKKPSFAEEASSETIYIEQEVEETPYSVEEAPEESVQFGLRRPKPKTIQKEEVEQEFKIKMGSYEEEEVAMSGKVRLPKKKKPVSFAEEADSETIYIEQEVEEGPADVKFPLRRKSSTTPYSVEEVEEEVQLGLRKPRKESIVYEEESLELKVKRKPSKPSIQSFHQEEASLHITKVVEEPGEVRIVETTEGSPLFSICSYVAETDDALSLVEGEKVYVIESNNSDWWFVKKHLTEEKGWVPAVYLRDEPSYTLYVQKKLHEKIDKLPIFEKPGPGAAVFAPKFVEKLQPKRVSDGGIVQFECKVEGNPRPQITWFRQTAIIKPSHDFQIFYDEDNVATLIISEIFPEDAGTFTCVAKNAAGFASSTTELVVESPLSDHGSDTAGLSRRSLSRESSLADILEGIPPTFSRKPKAKVVPPGSDVELEVRLVAIPEPEIQWFLKNKPVTPSANVSIVTQSDMHMYVNTMKISKVSRGQEGTYTVVAKNREGEASVDIILKIKTGEPEPPVVVDLVKDVTVTEGEGIVLTAQVAGVPTPKVVWLKDGRPVKLESSATGDTHTAVVRNSKPSDAGKYTLEATNSQGKASSTANVTVQDRRQQAPLFVERFEEVKVGEKGTIKLTAKVLANPIPSVTWFRNNKILLASPRITEMFDGEQILLEIENADSEQDAGDYKCVATNALGSATNGAKVTVDVAEVYFTKKLPSKYTVDENKNIIIECETSHTVSTTWFHDGKELSGMDNRELVQEGRTQRLVIKKASRKDKGTYTCKVKDKKTETNLIVHEVKPDFVRKLDDFEVKELQCAILEVEVSSDAADVVWTKDGMPLEPAPGKIEMEKRGPIHKLFIRSTSVHDEGEYTCQLGDEECSAEVTVIELPPEILTHLQDTSVPRGEKACLEVELTKGDALVRWFKDDVELQFSEHVQLSIDGKRQKLKIYQAEDSDGGIYSCKVGDQVSTARLTVEEPKVEFITRLPDVTMIPVGSDAEFTVELSVSDVDVKWLRKGKEIKPKADRYIITSSGATRKLVIKKVTLEDQTDITCMAINIKTTSKLKIEVIQTAPRITMDQKEYRVRKGEDVTFNLKFVGTPKLEHEWTVNGTVIKPSKRVIPSIDEESASLTIKKLEESDVGNYTLKLKNSVGEASAELTIIFIEVPGAPGTPEIVEVTDSSVTVTWKEPSSDGNSPITSYVLEHHDKEEFLSWNEITNITERTHKVTNLTKGHEVNFRVSAVNEVGKGKTSESSRYVKVEAPGSTQPPSFKEPLEDKACGIAKPVTLSCVVAGIPDPEVKWFKDGKALKSKTISYSNHVAKLTIESVVETSSGTYSCKASNSAGTAETSCKLAVQEAPTLKIDDDSLSQRLELRSQWKPVVEFSGYPAPQITWAKDGVPLVTDKRVTSYTDEKTTTVAIYSTDRKDSGTYTVTATNIAGSASLELKLKVIDKPTRPETIVIQEVEGEAVTIVWTPPADDGGVDISKYSLEKCDASKMIWTKVADIERDARTYVIQRLQCNAEYMFRIFAQNPVGTSDPAETNKVEITSKLGRPSTPTRPVEVSGMAETSCTITWGLPESDGGAPIVDYSVERKETDSDNWVKVGTTKDRHIIITELRKGKSYDFRIFARNRVGSSPPLVEENIIAGKTKTPPSPPNNIQVLNIASKSVTLKWEPPTSNGGSEVTDYVIEKQVNGSNTWTKVVTLDVNVLQFTIENLKEKSELYFRVFAENAVGLSLPTTTSLVSLKTHATVPSPPTAPLEMRSTGANSVMVSWGVPEKDGGAPIEGYKIAVRDMKKTMWMEVGRVGADVQKLTIKDLQENHEYLIRIYARNEVGMSDPLESDEPFRVQRPTGGEDIDVEDSRMDKDTPSLSFTTTTQSWMREAGMDPDIRSYSQSALLRRSEYFFRIWYYAKHLFK